MAEGLPTNEGDDTVPVIINDGTARQKERMETKLYLPRDVEGKPNKEELKIVGKIEKELSKYPSFIGVALLGSVVTGYNNSDGEPDYGDEGKQESDIDMLLLFDRNKITSGYEFDDIDANNFKLAVDLEQEHGKRIHFAYLVINTDEIKGKLKNLEGFPVVTLADMSRLVTGKKINEYRKPIVEEIKKLSPEEKKEFVDILTQYLFDIDTPSLEKRKERMPDLTLEEHKDILEARKEMWRKRVQKIWGIGELKTKQ